MSEQAKNLLKPENLVFLGICDLAGQVRGKAVPTIDLPERLLKGVDYTPANICLSAFGTLGASPFGTLGDIVLLPDPTTRVEIEFEASAPEHFYLADILTTEGQPWEYCPRSFLKRALQQLEKESGCTLFASFEQEFVYTGVSSQPRRVYALHSFREQELFGATLVAALRKAGMTPETFLAELGPRQFEVTVAPAEGLRAADEAVMVRELTRGVAVRQGHRAIFAPMIEPHGAGNGTHIHFSLRNHEGRAEMHDAARPYGLSAVGEQFVAGVLEHMPALTSITTPSVCSFYRLTPNRLAPTWANVCYRDRAASLRICPGSFADSANDTEAAASRFNVEYRVADATANPYMALGALVYAGVDGIRKRMALPKPAERSFAEMRDAERGAAGMRPLPNTLRTALVLLSSSAAAAGWFGQSFLDLYVNFKSEEEQMMAGLDAQATCDRYAEIY